jgi:hypothetical protein
MNPILIIAITVVAAAAVAAVVTVIVISRRKTDRRIRQVRDFEERCRYAIWATALVVRAEGGMAGETSGKSCMSVTLEVTPPGQATYRTTVSWLVNPASMGSLQPGSIIQVKIDARDPRIVYPGGDWATFLP